MLTEHQNHARELVREADLSQWDALVIMSGDGLLFEVIKRALRSDFDMKHLRSKIKRRSRINTFQTTSYDLKLNTMPAKKKSIVFIFTSYMSFRDSFEMCLFGFALHSHGR